MQEGSPLDIDEEYAKNSRYGSVIAPPTMLLTWPMPPLGPPGNDPSHPFEKFLEKLDQAGYLGIIVTNVNKKYYRPLFPGDKVTYSYKVTDVSPEKQTGLGKGFFVTAGFDFKNQKGETVGTQRCAVLKYGIG